MEQNNSHDFCCYLCNYKTNRKSSYQKHLLTIKHILNSKNLNSNNEIDIQKKYKCNVCNRFYTHRQSMYKHTKLCILNNSNNLNEIEKDNQKLITLSLDKEKDEYKELIKVLVEQNTNLQTMIKEMIPKIGNNNNNNNTIINNNKINMTLFLEQQCKGAPNMKDFIAGLQIQVGDLLHTKDKGIVNGITHIFLNGLKELDIYQRPIHCTDIKRQTLYIKDDDCWAHGAEGRKIFNGYR